MGIVARSLHSFKASIFVTLLGIVLAWFLGGPEQAFVVAILALLEISLSFENAVVNATVLGRMSKFWQRMFLTLGMVIAVVGMRLLFPVAIVMATARLKFGAVVDLAVHHPAVYAEKLELAHPSIASFGGMFLLMIFLDFLLDSGKQVHWIEVIERPLARVGRLRTVSVVFALVALAMVATWVQSDVREVLVGGILGLGTYLLVRFVTRLFEAFGGLSHDGKAKNSPRQPVTGLAALGLFVYLEVLDASFSFDGVVGAFAITGNVFSIMIGLGIGAMVIRELTVWLVRHDTLTELVYLEHGAYYAVGALAVMLALSLRFDIPDVVTGLVGAVFIGAALVSSLREQKAAKKITRKTS